jgi:hypothetical protein
MVANTSWCFKDSPLTRSMQAMSGDVLGHFFALCFGGGNVKGMLAKLGG